MKNTNLFWGDQPPQSLTPPALWSSGDETCPCWEGLQLVESQGFLGLAVLATGYIFCFLFYLLGQKQNHLAPFWRIPVYLMVASELCPEKTTSQEAWVGATLLPGILLWHARGPGISGGSYCS